jgi:hypothetical protein
VGGSENKREDPQESKWRKMNETGGVRRVKANTVVGNGSHLGDLVGIKRNVTKGLNQYTDDFSFFKMRQRHYQ